MKSVNECEIRAKNMFYPGDARIPEVLRTDEFLVRPLRATDVALDYDAVISSRAELLLGSAGTWPREGFTRYFHSPADRGTPDPAVRGDGTAAPVHPETPPTVP